MVGREMRLQPRPVDQSRQPHQLIPHVNDICQLRAKQFLRAAYLLRRPRFHPLSRKTNCKISALIMRKACNFKNGSGIQIANKFTILFNF
jgi:hypothetical protein